MGGGEIAYFTTVATVIPVLFLVYTVSLKDVFKELLNRERATRKAVGEIRPADHPVRRLLESFALTVIRTLLALVVLVPIGAEVICLTSLGTEKPEQTAKAFVAIGLGVAALPIFVPLFYAFGLEPLIVQLLDSARSVKDLPKRIAVREASKKD
jgi:hypothetical protein